MVTSWCAAMAYVVHRTMQASIYKQRNIITGGKNGIKEYGVEKLSMNASVLYTSTTRNG